MTRVSDSEFDTSHLQVWAPSLGVQRIPAGHHLLASRAPRTVGNPRQPSTAHLTGSRRCPPIRTTPGSTVARLKRLAWTQCVRCPPVWPILESSCSLHPSCQQTTAPPGLPDAVVQRNERRRGPCAHARCFRGEHPRTTCRMTFAHHDTSLYARPGTPHTPNDIEDTGGDARQTRHQPGRQPVVVVFLAPPPLQGSQSMLRRACENDGGRPTCTSSQLGRLRQRAKIVESAALGPIPPRAPGYLLRVRT